MHWINKIEKASSCHKFVNVTRWSVTHANKKHWWSFAFIFFFVPKLAFDYSKMKAIMGKDHRDSKKIQSTEEE